MSSSNLRQFDQCSINAFKSINYNEAEIGQIIINESIKNSYYDSKIKNENEKLE